MESIVETARLCIRPFCPDDLEPLYRLSREPQARRELPDEVCETLDQARDLLEFLDACRLAREYPLVFAVALRTTGEMIGHISLSEIGGGRIEIGYAIAQAHQGQGYASELMLPFARWAKREMGLSALYGIVKAANAPSRRILEKSGFRFLREEARVVWGAERLMRDYVLDLERLEDDWQQTL